MDWIKVNTTLPRNPKVLRLASLMGIDRHTALGLMLEWLCWLDGVSRDGSTGISAKLIDALFSSEMSQNFVTSVTRETETCHTLTEALVTIGWASEGENGEIYAAEFEKHNGENAKKRAEDAERKRKSRSRKKSQNSVTSVTKKCDQRREEKIYKKEDSIESSKKTRRTTKIALPETSDDVLTFLAAQPNCGLRGDELMACAEAFYNEFEAVGWTMRNQPVQNWHSAARSFLAKWQNNNASVVAAAPRGRITYRSETQQNYEL